MKPAANAEMLKLARESRRYTQSEVAATLHIPQASFSKYESGMCIVPEEELKSIARFLDYPVSFFHLNDRRYEFGSTCTYHRKRQTLPASTMKWLLSVLNILRIHVSHLLDSVDIEAQNEFPRNDSEDFGGNAEKIAQLVRQSWKLSPGPVANMTEVIERAGGLVYAFPFGTNKVDALSQSLPMTPPIFLVNSDIPGDRLRFTLAHEVGHIIMHQIATEDMEGEADRFASEFLMPAQDIVHDLSAPLTLVLAAKLKTVWKVSMQAIARRARDLGKIEDRQYRYFFEQISKKGWRTAEPNPLPVEEPKLFQKLIRVHLKDLEYSTEELADLLCLSETELQASYLKTTKKLTLLPSNKPQLSIC